jgi:1,4-alpha-glucan branching enzyme
MPGDDWQKFANLRLLYGYMYTQPGKKLLFMGGEIAQWREWNHDRELDWHLLEHHHHAGIHAWVRDLNHFYQSEPAAHELDFDPPASSGWTPMTHGTACCHTYGSRGLSAGTAAGRVLVICNFTPLVRRTTASACPASGYWREMLNSDAEVYGGSGVGNMGGVSRCRSHSTAGRTR